MEKELREGTGKFAADHPRGGWFGTFLNKFPMHARIPAGVLAICTGGVLAYAITLPKVTNPVRTLTPEWKKANLEYRKHLHMDPISHPENRRTV